MTPSTTKVEVKSLSRKEIYAELKWMHTLVGGRGNVDKLDKVYTFEPNGEAKVFLDAAARYSELENELTRRRNVSALWATYVHTSKSFKLSEIAHMKGGQ